MDNFEKEAQKRSVTKMLGNAVNPMEWIRQLSSSKYRRMIASIDSVDKIMRNNVLRLKPDLRDRLHQARMAFKNREFRKVFQFATYILDAVNGVFIDQMDQLEYISNEIYSEFSQDTMHDFEKQILEEDLGVRRRAGADSEILIEAGITQWLQEKIPTKKEIEGNLFDKIFRNMQGKQQEAARQALSIAEQTYNLIKEAFAILDDNRKNIVEYIKLAKDYQRKLSIEKDRLKRLYMNYFPIEQQKPSQEPAPQQSQVQQTEQAAQPPAVQPVTNQKPSTGPVASPTTNPVVTQNAPVSITEKKESAIVNDLISKANKAVFEGNVGVGVALLVKASEICEECGDESNSINLLETAFWLERAE